MKNARPTRSGRQWGSHFEFRSGTQNHWKTPTWLQCKLPGQPELPTVAVKVKMPWKNGGKAERTGGRLHSAPSARRKANNHAGHSFVKDVSWSFLLCHSLPSTCFGSDQTSTSQLHHWHTHTLTHRRTQYKCIWVISPLWAPTLPSKGTHDNVQAHWNTQARTHSDTHTHTHRVIHLIIYGNREVTACIFPRSHLKATWHVGDKHLTTKGKFESKPESFLDNVAFFVCLFVWCFVF